MKGHAQTTCELSLRVEQAPRETFQRLNQAAIYLIWRNRAAAVICIISAVLFTGLNLFLLSPPQSQNDPISKTTDQDAMAKSIIPQGPAPKPTEGNSNTNQKSIEKDAPRTRSLASNTHLDPIPAKPDENRFSNFRVTASGDNFVDIDVTYFYNGAAGKDDIELFIGPIGKDGRAGGGQLEPLPIVGHEATWRTGYSISPDPGKEVKTYQIELCMEYQSKPFYCRRFPLVKTWTYNPPSK